MKINITISEIMNNEHIKIYIFYRTIIENENILQINLLINNLIVTLKNSSIEGLFTK